MEKYLFYNPIVEYSGVLRYYENQKDKSIEFYDILDKYIKRKQYSVSGDEIS